MLHYDERLLQEYEYVEFVLSQEFKQSHELFSYLPIIEILKYLGVGRYDLRFNEENNLLRGFVEST